jgi:thiamine-phosphate pyrophosphorylase
VPVLPRVYPIVDTATLAASGMDPVEFAAALLDGGARLLQFRHKGAYSAERFEQLHGVAALCRDAGAQLIVNDRADVAAILDAGLHIGQDDLAPEVARGVIGTALLGLSTNGVEQMRAAAREPVDYVALGPIFATSSKPDADAAVGLAVLRACRALTARPLVAIGGITLENAAQVLEAGADSVCVIRGLLPSNSDGAALRLRDVRARVEEWIRCVGP